MKRVFEIKNVTKTYKKGKVTANENISFSIMQGEILGLLGPNGAGKSTLIKQIVAHVQPSEGKILYNGTDVSTQSRLVSREVAYYAQEPASLTSLKVNEALYFTARLRGMKKSAAKEQTNQLLEKLGLQESGNKQLKRLSGGQKRLAGIGTTLIGAAAVLIFDEPTNELDPKKRRLVWDLIQERNREGATIILVTHNILEAEQVVDRVAVINHGKLLAIDSVSTLKNRVDQRLKADITLATPQPPAMEALQSWGQLVPLTEHRCRLLIEKDRAAELLTFLNEAQAEGIHSYAISPPSLEDVYFHIDKDPEEAEEEEKLYANA
ncbi:ABC-2 type transport system ATP-binding protein [Evansella caseinilytica]|uniref:ABC-2 type transport system ATP-binding protein n=1 Tax=Evansella caseinilytica TaxID=1503961 RepID=A0A1H3PJ41_9BACI|nr:ABC transporter ATP-binding protein [Evansella caseinilytica]SDZ01091.1 ABC-2 type transport system ATP-binding protein [Evansella caseinilytica]